MADTLTKLLREAYRDTHELLVNPEMYSVVANGLLISYGPPIHNPDLLILTFQGAGDDGITQKEWPSKLLFLNSPYKFGRELRRLCCATGWFRSLQNSAMALPAVFPQSKKSSVWLKQSDPYARWRRHSVDWVERLTDEIQPKVVMVLGEQTSKALKLEWKRERRGPGRQGRLFGTSVFRGLPTVYCHHLSQGYDWKEALRCFHYARELLDRRCG